MKKIIVGRDDICDVVIDNDSVSRQHLSILIHKEKIQVLDNKSTNGTFIEKKGKKVRLISSRVYLDDYLYLGNSRILVRDILSQVYQRKFSRYIRNPLTAEIICIKHEH